MITQAGPGRSGGANGVLSKSTPNSYNVIDEIEAGKITPIKDFNKELPGFENFIKLLTELKALNIDLPDYLSEAYTKKQWYFVEANINNIQCENGTLIDLQPDQKIILICQFQDKVFVNKTAFFNIKEPQSKSKSQSKSQSQLTVLVHEGLVNQMLKYLIPLESKYTEAQIDKLQKQIEIVIHKISVKLANKSYSSFHELQVDLKEASLPLLYSNEEKQNIYISPEPEKFILSTNYFIGASEKFQLMSKLYENAAIFNPELLQKKYGSEVCMVNYSGSSIPGYWVGAYLRLDAIIPELLFTTQIVRFDSYKFDEKKLLQSIKEKIALTPLKKTADNHWTGEISFSIAALEKVIGEMSKDWDTEDKAYFAKYLQYQQSLASERLIQLDIRELNENTIIIRRLVYSKKPNSELQLINADYGMGALKSYPNECMSNR